MTPDDIAPLVAQVQAERRAVLLELYGDRFGDDGGGPSHSIHLHSVRPERVAPALSRLAADRLAETYPEIAAPEGYTSAGVRCWITPAGIAEVERMCAAREDDAALVERVADAMFVALPFCRDDATLTSRDGWQWARACGKGLSEAKPDFADDFRNVARKVIALVRGEAG